MTDQLQMPGINPWACDECHDKGRIVELWGKTAGRTHRCSQGCPQVPWSDNEDERAHVIRHKALPPLGAGA